MKALVHCAVGAVFTASLGLASAQTTAPATTAPATTAAPTTQVTAMTDGEVRKVDKAAGKVTLKHGPIKNLDMPGMTMVFQVKDASMLERVKAGDKVRFAAEGTDGRYTVTDIQPAP